MTTYYKVALNGVVEGQQIVNILWYRHTTIWGGLGDYLDFANALAAEVKENIWDSRAPAHVGGYGLQELLPEQYTLQNITVQGYADDFALFASDPVEFLVNEDGLQSEESNGPAPCFIFSANLEPAFGPGVGLPTRGYLAIGPICDTMIDPTGHVHSTWFDQWQTVGDHLAENIVTEAPVATVFPVRTRVTRVAGVVTFITYKDVSAFVLKDRASFRRSRLPEA